MHLIPSCPDEHDLFLTFKGHSVRIVLRGRVPLFALPDICDAVGLLGPRASLVRRLPDHAKTIYGVTAPDGVEDIDMLTPIGVWLYGQLDNPGRYQAISAWARRESLQLYPEAEPDNPAMFIQLELDGSLPPRPMKYSGRLAEWKELQVSDERFERIANRHNLRSGLNAMQSLLASMENAA